MKSPLIPSKMELYATSIACLGTLLSGVDLTFSADLITKMKDLPITIREQALIALSSLVITYFLNILGRKNSLLLILFCHIIAWMLMYFFSFSMTMVYISRAFSGFGSGMRTPTTLYITETSHKSRRGILISILGLSVSLGIALTYVIQYFSSWRIVALFSLVTSVAGFIQTCFLKETKYWHLFKGNVEKAEKSIKWFNKSLSQAEIEAEVDEILSTDSQLKDRKISIIDSLKNRTNIKCFMCGLLLITFQFACGRVQITAHPYNYYIKFKLPVSYSTITLVQGVLEMVMSVVCSFIIDLVPRRTMVQFCCWSMNACLIVALFHDILETSCGLIGQWVLLIALMIFYGYASGILLCLTSIMVAEIVSVTTEARAVLQSLIYVWGNLVSGVCTQIFPYALAAAPVDYVILFFLINLTLLSFTGFFAPETRGKALHHCSAANKSKQSKQAIYTIEKT